jgi:hypothetical protein
MRPGSPRLGQYWMANSITFRQAMITNNKETTKPQVIDIECPLGYKCGVIWNVSSNHVRGVLHRVETVVRVSDDTPYISNDNKWLMPTPAQSIPYLSLSAPKRHAESKLRALQYHAVPCSTSVLQSSSKAERFFAR